MITLAVALVGGAIDLAPARAKSATSRQAPIAAAMTAVGHPGKIGHQGKGPTLPRVAQLLADKASLHIVAFGSSSTQGIGASSLASSYPSRLQADLSVLLPDTKVSVVNAGIGGEDAADMALRLPRILAARPDLVIFQTGTNDPLRGVPLGRFIDLTRDVVTRLQAASIDVMLMEPQLCRVTTATPASIFYRDAVRSIATEMRVPLIRRWDLMESWLSHDLVTPVEMLAPDGLHMADAGYALLAHEVAREIVADTR